MQGPAITEDFVMSQLRLALVALFAYGGGKGWFTPADTTFYLALMTSLGPLLAPWIWSIFSNLGTVRISSNSAAAVVAQVEKTDQTAATVGASAATAAVVKVLLIAFALSAFLAVPSAMAQVKTPQQIINDLRAQVEGLKQQVATVATPASPAAAVPCDFKMLTKLTPDNLTPTAKACLSDVNQKLVNDTQRALDSAKAFGSSGDGDGVNCLTPGLAIFKAGVQVPAVPAVTAADGTVTTPAVPAQDPGPILLYQKYREFTLAGGLTSCQTWFNGPINSTAAAGVAGAGAALAGAALLAPK